MTMIALATYGDRAEIITDSVSYLSNGADLGRCTKVLTIPHLDAAIATQGSSTFGVDAKSAALQIANQVATFDDLVDQIPKHLRTLWAQCLEEHIEPSDSVVFLIGYSPRTERFEAHMFASDYRDFTAQRLTAPRVMPCPWSLRPDILEMKRFRAWSKDASARHGERDQGHEVVQMWVDKPAMEAPATTDEWVELAKKVRQERALEDFANVYVAGDVFHTRISRGEATTRKIHTYDDEGEEFLRMISGTQHPIAQLMPCWCGSGEDSIDCHLAAALDEPCGCKQSAKRFRECCAAPSALHSPGAAARSGIQRHASASRTEDVAT